MNFATNLYVFEGVRWPRGRVSDSRTRGRGSIPTPPGSVLKQRHIYFPKSTGNIQEVLAPCRHERSC